MGDGKSQLAPCLKREFANYKCGFTAKQKQGCVMMPKFGRIAVVSTAVLTFAAATVPTKADAFGFLLAPALIGSAIIGAGAGAWGGGPYGGGPYAGGSYGCCQVWAPPPPPPPPPCCYYGGQGWGRGGYGGGGYGGGGYGGW